MELLDKQVLALKPPTQPPNGEVREHQRQLLTAAIESELLDSHSGTGRRPSRRRGRRVSVAATVAAAIALAGGAAAAAVVYLQPQPVTNHDIARCYSVDSTAGGFHGSDIATAGTPGSPAQIQDAVQVCALLWRDGFLVPGAPHALHLPGGPLTQHAVPPLTACRLPGGIAGVFPGTASTCQRLGLPPAQTNQP